MALSTLVALVADLFPAARQAGGERESRWRTATIFWYYWCGKLPSSLPTTPISQPLNCIDIVRDDWCHWSNGTPHLQPVIFFSRLLTFLVALNEFHGCGSSESSSAFRLLPANHSHTSHPTPLASVVSSYFQCRYFHILRCSLDIVSHLPGKGCFSVRFWWDSNPQSLGDFVLSISCLFFSAVVFDSGGPCVAPVCVVVMSVGRFNDE